MFPTLVFCPDDCFAVIPSDAVGFQIEYDAFESNFYSEHKDITKLTESDVSELRKRLGLKVR